MRILAIDYGEKRLGLAISDELKMTARPLITIMRVPKEKSFSKIKHYVEELNVSQIVVGLPIKLDGTIGDAALRVEKFVSHLKEILTCPIVTWDEKLTSYQAEERMRNSGLSLSERRLRIDEFAALIILEDYLINQN
ncbi:MAG: Holliday junction resolvase RuvX [Acidobacteria bacterium]|nr:Holliday junction resolvase RuvX [Acidobacteriota bacterium]